MGIKDILENLPQIFQYFFPGAIAVFLFKWSALKRDFSFSNFLITSCIISYMELSFMNAYFPAVNIWHQVIYSILISALLSLFLAWLLRCKSFNKLLINVFSISSHNDVIEGTIDTKNGSVVKVFLKDKEYYFYGDYRAYDGVFLLISAPGKKEIKTGTELYKQESDNSFLVCKLEDIDYLEILN